MRQPYGHVSVALVRQSPVQDLHIVHHKKIACLTGVHPRNMERGNNLTNLKAPLARQHYPDIADSEIGRMQASSLSCL